MTQPLSVTDVSVAFDGREVLSQVTFDVAAGEFVGLIGPNGAGKTTLLRAIARLVPYDGRIAVDGRDTRLLPRRELARSIAYLAQGHVASWPLEARQIVSLGRLPHVSPWRQSSPIDDKVIDEAMMRSDVSRLAHQNIDALSAGERARVMLARALAVDAPILLADEPIASLDPFHQLQIMELLRERAATGTTIVMVTHDLTLAARYCGRLFLLSDGRLVADGTSETVLTDEFLLKVYGIEALRSTYGGEPYVLPWRRVDAAAGEVKAGPTNP